MAPKWSSRRDFYIVLLVSFGLLLPFLHVPVDSATRIEVSFRTGEMAKPHAFNAYTSRTVCTILTTALAYEDPDTGEYTRITCSP